MSDADQPRRLPEWGHGQDDTSELPTATHRIPPASGGEDRTEEFGHRPSRSVPADEGFSKGPVMAPNFGPVREAQRESGPQRFGMEPVPTPYGATAEPVVRRYGPVLPAVVAAIAAALIALVPSLMQRNGVRPPSGDLWATLWGHATFFNLSAAVGSFRASSTGELALVVGTLAVVTFIVVVLAMSSLRTVPGRAALFFATWGAVMLAGAAAGGASVRTSNFVVITGIIDTGASFGLWFGWIPALVAVLVRVGRRTAAPA